MIYKKNLAKAFPRLFSASTIFHSSLSIGLIASIPMLLSTPSYAVDGDEVQVFTDNNWKAFEVITQDDNVSGDGSNHRMPNVFDGTGAWFPTPNTLRILVNHETGDASISEVDLDLAAFQRAISNMINQNNTGDVRFVNAARQAYDRWSSNGGFSWSTTSSTSNTRFFRFCSGQSYDANTFGKNRGFVDPLYITGEEVRNGRLFVLDNANRDLYQLSGTVGRVSQGIGGMPYDAWENAALIDTGETQHIALLLSPDGGSERMKLYIGEKGKNRNGNTDNSFLARNGLAYGSWYYLNSSLPSLNRTNRGWFDTTSSSALRSSKLEDIDTSKSDPTKVVLGDQNSGVFTFDFNLVFNNGFSASASSFSLTKISNESGGRGSLDSPDNVDWTATTTLGNTAYPEGIIFVNEDNGTGEIWKMTPDGSNKERIASTKVGAESSGVFDISEYVGYLPGSIILTSNQGYPSSLSVLINPEASL